MRSKPSLKASKSHSRLRKSAASKSGGSDAYSADQLYRTLYDAIANLKLRPGQKLPEEVIAQAFSVTRWAIRPVLRQLAADGVVTIVPFRGAFVAKPNMRDAREVYAARRIIESGLVAQMGKLSASDVERINHHLDCEDCARRDRDTKSQRRLGGEFHILLAQIAGNPLLSRVLSDLLAKNALAVSVYQRNSSLTCRPDDHRALVVLLREGKQAAAARLMIKHLDAIERSLDFDTPEEDEPDIGATLSAIREERP